MRDVLIIRSSQDWEIGISAKNNHRAVKHPRLSEKLDFGKKWMGLGCSDAYFATILPIFKFLKETKENDPSTLWSSLEDKEDTIYVPILNAFKKELIRLVETDSKVVPKNLVEFLIGNLDFYKIIRADDKVEIQGYNLHGTLNLPFQNQKPKAKISKLDFPTRLVEIVFLEDSKTTLMAYFNKGWTISFRLHNASSRVEPSLKFDINLVSAPYSLFTTQILI